LAACLLAATPIRASTDAELTAVSRTIGDQVRSRQFAKLDRQGDGFRRGKVRLSDGRWKLSILLVP
jgi:hypothetical protein